MSKTDSRFSKPSPYDEANFLSRFFFFYLIPLFAKGVKNDGLQMDDLYRCSVEDETQEGVRKLAQNWDKDKRAKSPSFAWTIARTYARYFICPMVLFVFQEFVFQLGGPLLLSRVIRYFNGDPKIDYLEACLCAAGVCACNLAFTATSQCIMMAFLHLGIRMRTACVTLMYHKSLKLSQASLGQTQAGQIINLMSNDVGRFEDFSMYIRSLFVAPVQSAIIIYIVWTYLGYTVFVGVAVLFLYLPVQGLLFGRMFAKVRLGIANLTDTRLRYMNEIISGMRVIKMYCWERPFAERVAEARKAEIAQVRKSCILKAINIAISQVGNRLFLFACFVVYVLLGNILEAEAVFVSMQLFYTLSSAMTWSFPMAISTTSELMITCKRIQKFLLLDEMQVDRPKATTGSSTRNKPTESIRLNRLQTNAYVKNVGPCLRLSKITAKWDKNASVSTLKDIFVDLKPGDLLAIIGPVGSGKSSFLMSLLKELPLESGHIEMEGSISYASQDAWSFQDSVRANILFGSEYNEARYRAVVEVCALSRDLALMPFNDQTLVGEKGVLLSGGQKARINLARAVYRDADICLMDDPLSAVDAPVAKHIFEKCIMKHLQAKIRVLVTHQIQFIEKATKILVLNKGTCMAYGSYEQILEQGIDFVSLLHNELKEQNKENNSDVKLARSMSEESQQQPLDKTVDDQAEIENERVVQMEDETFQKGQLQGRIYAKYVRAGAGFCMLLSMVFFALLSQALFNGSDIFLSYWTNQNQKDEDAARESNIRDIIIYSSLIGGLLVVNIVRGVTFFIACMRSSVVLHNKTFARLLRAPIAFFDSNPAGRILNRFAKDIGNIDEKLPYIWYDFTLHGGQALGVLVTVCIMRWILIIPALILLVFIIFLRQVYLKSATYLQRYEGIARSPVYSHVTTTINGLASIRAYGAQSQFTKQFFTYQNDHMATLLIFSCAAKAMGMAMSFCCGLFVCVITAVVMFAKDTASGTAGLIISSGLGMTTAMQWGVRMSAEFENQMVSVERVLEYQKLGQEALPESSKETKPPQEWPSSGKISFEHMSLSYGGNSEDGESPKPVLRDISCTIEGGEKVGIVGRTGAGKSSTIAALFRLTEPSGTIHIDGVNITKLGLDDLRKKISIIPQDPVVFSGTVRYNLDPFNEYANADLWMALEKVQLKAQVSELEGGLDAKLSDRGSNLSVGQRQLICLARAILRLNRILILDEATASVDHQTDALIQQTIRAEFGQCTVLTIAHRLNTIIDCDRVMVLDAGKIVQFDTPFHLLQSKGIFCEMCKKTGPNMYSYLFQIAQKVHNNKKALS